MVFQVSREIGPFILEGSFDRYPYSPIYFDRRFGHFCDQRPEVKGSLPSSAELLSHMEKRVGTPYVWGGNWAEGIPEMLQYYPPQGILSKRMEELWMMKGLDCSGLLFEASLGVTPRNTSELLFYGQEVKLEELRPMDMIIYPGHVLFVRDQETIIESKAGFGVRICSLSERLCQIQSESYCFRRFCEVIFE